MSFGWHETLDRINTMRQERRRVWTSWGNTFSKFAHVPAVSRRPAIRLSAFSDRVGRAARSGLKNRARDPRWWNGMEGRKERKKKGGGVIKSRWKCNEWGIEEIDSYRNQFTLLRKNINYTKSDRVKSTSAVGRRIVNDSP